MNWRVDDTWCARTTGWWRRGTALFWAALIVTWWLPGAALAASPLCASSANNQSYEWITRVKIHDGEESTGPSPYHDGTAVPLADLVAGED